MLSYYAAIGAAAEVDSDVITARRSQASSQGRFCRERGSALVTGPWFSGARRLLSTGGDMTGYTPDEKLRLQQLRELRRRWLKDQELSPREPVLPPQKMWPMERFWNKFLQDQAPWKNVVSNRLPPPPCT